MFHFPKLWQLVSAILVVSAASSTVKGTQPPSQFVSTEKDHFVLNGSVFNFIGTNAYWLHALNTEEDIDNTLANISAANFTVVRTWAYNDVDTIPINGTWFQLIANGTTTINNGTNGLQKLDKVVQLAKKHGIYLLLSLTNNWDPRAVNASAQATNGSLTRNTLSNDYGGMDHYVQNLGDIYQHDQFYVNQTILDAFQNYTTQIVSRYVNEPHVLAWELANDPRCNSTLPSASTCNTETVTKWHSIVAQHIRSIDPNHLITSGNQGYFCADCPKLFPRSTTTSGSQPSASPTAKSQRRSLPKPLTRARILQERKAASKIQRARRALSGETSDGIKIRGRWVASQTKRQEDIGVGSAFDGSYGVDSEDILNIPQIGFGSFQLFPDQYSYGSAVDPTLPVFNQTLQIGLDWIRRHAEAGNLYDKPVSLNAFGLVTQGNSQSFVPFNQSVPPFALGQGNATPPPLISNQGDTAFVTDQERDLAYYQWVQAGISSGLQGIVQYQWSQGDLTPQDGTPISPSTNESGESPDQNVSGVSPNDGYGIIGQGEPQAIGSIQSASAGFGSDGSSA